MFSRSTCLALVLAIAFAASGVRADEERDAQDVRATVKAFVAAVARGDTAGARRNATSDDITGTLIEYAVPLVTAATKLQDAATAKFGPRASVFGGQMNPKQAIAQMANGVDEAEVRFNGRTALLMPVQPQRPPANANGQDGQQQNQQDPQQNAPDQQNNNGQDQPNDQPAVRPNARNRGLGNPSQGLPLRKEGEKWKVDLSNIPNVERIIQFAPVLREVGEAMLETANEIRANEYENVQEAQQAMRQKMMVAVFAAMRAQQQQ